MSVFEIIMLLCFGAAWPFSIYKSYRSGSNNGKSIIFLLIVLIGYAAGVLHKIYYNFNMVIVFYCVNLAMVALDCLIFIRNSRLGAVRKIKTD